MPAEFRIRNREESALEETVLAGQRDPRVLVHETSRETFDRLQFAARALELLGPRKTTVALAPSRTMMVESGTAWGRGEGARWAALYIPSNASRRAIAVAVLSLGGAPLTPYAVDVLMNADLL